MWNYLKGLLRSGLLLSRLYYLFLSFVACVMVICALPYSLIFAAVAFPAIKVALEQFGLNSVVPYWGKIFGRKAVYRLLAEDRFHPYVNKMGETVKRIQISESGRWIRFRGRYYPIPLMKSIAYWKNRPEESVITMIDGGTLKGVKGLRDRQEGKAFEEILKSTCDFSNDVYKKAFYAAESKSKFSSLAEADWNDFRYRWEQECIVIASEHSSEKTRVQLLRAISSPDKAKNYFTHMSLTDDEIEEVCKAVRKGRIKDIRVFASLAIYEKEIYVCNATRLYEKLGYPDNEKSMDFLFDCLKDIKKPYCDDAVKALLTFPKDVLIKRIDADIQRAHATENLLWAAGLLALAKSINYEISLTKEVQQEAEQQKSEQQEAASLSAH